MSGNVVKRSRGFTLIELMIVVAIIGILAAVAIPSFINYQLTSKRTEAYSNLAALAKAQKSYFAEFNDFVGVLSEPTGGLGAGPTNVKRSNASVGPAFAAVGWVPDGDVFFDYDTATAAAPGNAVCTCVESCFTATAYGDLDGNGLLSALIYAHPDVAGNYCESTMSNLSPPLDGTGVRQFDGVARVTLADDF